jgi:hypothetical protein
MNAAVLDDTTLSCMARFIMLWILRNPSEAINPEEIAETNRVPLKTVKALLNELAAPEHGYLLKPKRVNDPVKAGQFTWTPYTLNPSYGQRDNGHPSDLNPEDDYTGNGKPIRTETPSDQNPSMAATSNGAFEPVEYTHAAGEKELLKELKESTEFEVIKTNQASSLNVIEPGALARSTEADTFQAELEAKPPDVQAAYQRAYSRANRPKHDDSSAPNPDAAEPLPPDVSKAYLKHWARFAISKNERRILHELIGIYGEPELVAIIRTADKVDWQGNSIKNPAAWLRTVGSKPKPAAPATPAYEFPPEDDLPQPDIAPEPPPDPDWQRLCWAVENMSKTLYSTYLKKCRYGGYMEGVLTIFAANEHVQSGCQIEMNHRGWFDKHCETIWQDFKSVQFVIEGVT